MALEPLRKAKLSLGAVATLITLRARAWSRVSRCLDAYVPGAGCRGASRIPCNAALPRQGVAKAR